MGLGPNDHELVYLSDNGGHGNLWVLPLGGGEPHQITFEKDPDLIMGVPIWAPDGDLITLATARPSSDERGVGYWVIHPDGSGLRIALPLAAWATWSGDSKWLYYSESSPFAGNWELPAHEGSHRGRSRSGGTH